ncbi:MAG: hypothetical protein KDA61_14090, partial [Planctomycetales bacterium]|nr:hypothetical protein [Planctomycetales bacterium]
PLPWTGDFADGLGNKISMLAYANPTKIADERQRGDGYGLVRFNKLTRQATIECWPRFADVGDGDAAQFAGWPVTIALEDNDGRKPVAWLPTLEFTHLDRPVVQVIDADSDEILYTFRISGKQFRPPVYRTGLYRVRYGADGPDRELARLLTATTAETTPLQIDR